MSARDSAAGRRIHGPDGGLGFPSETLIFDSTKQVLNLISAQGRVCTERDSPKAPSP